ncbi:MAG: hypothetical protein ACOX6T_09615 [Myxococcales bacterium]|jgi:hypothetical protein
MNKPALVLALGSLIATACAPSLAQRREAAAGTLQALREARFEATAAEAGKVLEVDAENPYARLAAAIARYRAAAHQIATDIPTVFLSGLHTRGVNDRYLRMALEQFEKDLGLVEDDLAVAAKFPDLALDLCIACWEVDWNRSGEVDDSDRRLLEIELDENGDELAPDDPRRRPTYRFDHGDVLWARAIISFQRAIVDVLLAYRWDALNKVLPGLVLGMAPTITLELAHPERIAAAREALLRGLDFADAARRSYLAESDDEREWVPNPRQKDYPMPLVVDEALYQTWELVVADLRKLLSGQEGLGAADMLQLADPSESEEMPKGYLDIGGMLARPKNIVLDLGQLMRDLDGERAEPLLQHFFGEFYVPTMKPSQLPTRLMRMKGEIDRGEESLGRKIRYLLWLN